MPSALRGLSAAHDITNSLDSVINLLYVLEKGETFTANGLRLLSAVREEIMRVAQIARERLAEHRNKATRETINLGELLDDVLLLQKSRLEAKNITVRCKYSFSGGILLYAVQIREAFANLFLNAIYAMPDGGILTIRIAEGRDWRLNIRGVRVLVADNGSGIMRKHLPRVFEPFFTTKGAEGNGIGLSIVQEIVQGHGGNLRVRSSVRREASGTVFSIFLPHGIRERDPAT